MSLDFVGDLMGYVNKIPNTFYYYLITQDDFSTTAGKMLIPPVDVVHSLYYAPYTDVDNFDCINVEFDFKRFPLNNKVYLPNTSYKRIKTQDIVNSRKFGTNFKAYKPTKNIGGTRNWRNEGKLYQFPFMYGVIDDNLMNPLDFKYHLCPYNDIAVAVSSPLNDAGTYSVEIEGYKGDTANVMEYHVVTTNTMPTVSNAYSQYMAYNKAQLNSKKTATLINSAVAVGGIVAAPFTGGMSLGATAMAGASIFNSINSLQATERDLKDQPNKVLSGGNQNALFNLKRLTNGFKLRHIRYQLKDEEMQKIGDFFAMFGYKQNKILTPNIRNRHYYNYMKTIGVNIRANGIPKEHLNKLKAIYDSGVTIWHIDRDNVYVGDYSQDNFEV